MKNILHIGIFRASNIGDLVISNEIQKYLKNKNNQSVEMMDLNTLKKIKCFDLNISKNPRHNIITKFKINLSEHTLLGYSYLRYLQFSASKKSNKMYDEYKAILDKFDLICIGGGNLIMSTTNDVWAIKINRLVKIAKERNKKVYIMSVGAGPILSSRSKKLFKETIEIADYVTVRDEYSKSLLKDDLNIEKDVKVTGDPVLLLSDDTVTSRKGEQDNINIAISIMPFGKVKSLRLSGYESYDYYKKMYRNIIEYFCKMNCNYILNLFSTELSDYDAIEDIYTYVLETSGYVSEKNLRIIYIATLDDLLKFYSTQSLLIGTRMHSLIIGYTQSLPIIAISWQKKVEGFMKYVNLSRFCYNLNTVNERVDEIYVDVSFILTCGEQNNKKELTRMRDNFDSINISYI